MTRKKITIKEAIAIFSQREIGSSYSTIWRWCKQGLLAAEWDELARRYRPYLDAVKKFSPPKKGNPNIAKLRKKVLRRKSRNND